jgi:DNA-binding NarL/FixJ family response regulator
MSFYESVRKRLAMRFVMPSRRSSRPPCVGRPEGEEDIRRALRAGAKGYVLKGTKRDRILETVRKVYEGEPSLSAEVAAKLADSLTHPELSERELQVLKYMASGKSNKEIAQVIYVSENTVKAHVKSILAKMDAMGRTAAIAIAIKRGLIEAP